MVVAVAAASTIWSVEPTHLIDLHSVVLQVVVHHIGAPVSIQALTVIPHGKKAQHLATLQPQQSHPVFFKQNTCSTVPGAQLQDPNFEQTASHKERLFVH
jgi:hypothetical protein